MRQLGLHLGRPLVLLLAVFLSAACSASAPTTSPRARLVEVNERDFRITITPNRVPTQNVLLLVRNQGPDTHELIVVRSRSKLPLRLDGLTVSEEALSRYTVASLDGAGPGTTRYVRLRLSPVRYELFCNLAGHFMAGMHGELVVQ